MWSNVELQITVSLNNLNNQIKGSVNVIILIMILNQVISVQIKKGINVLREAIRAFQNRPYMLGR